jgi:hypothetical protein
MMMVSESGRCYTPTSLWNELRALPTGIYKISVTKKNKYEVDFVILGR